MLISFLFDQTGCFLAGGRARVKHSKFVWERLGSPEPVEGQPRLKSIEFHYSMFDVGRSMFDVH